MIIYTNLAQEDNEGNGLPIGFDNRFKNFEDYILTITEEIWEQRAIWVLYDTYAKDVIIHSGAHTVNGFDTVVHGTLKTLYSFPDRTMAAEAVIWAQYKDIGGKNPPPHTLDKKFTNYFSSHRIYSSASNLGSTVYGKPTHKRIHFRTIADCLAKANIIYEEWLVRDNLDIVLQLGFDPKEQALKDTKYKKYDIASYDDGCEEIDLSNFKAQSENFEIGVRYFSKVWQEKEFSSVAQFFAENANTQGVCKKLADTHDERIAMYNDLFSCVKDGAIVCNQITCTEYEDRTELAIRWRLKGIHNGQGILGEATNNYINILGISHFIIKDSKITSEWIVYDAYDALCQTLST